MHNGAASQPTPPLPRSICLAIILAIVALGTLSCQPLLAADHGFIRVTKNSRYFQFEDGTPFFPIGQNDWPPKFDLRTQPREKLDAYFANLHAHGVNVLRIMVEAAKPKQNIFVETRPGEFNPEFERWMDTMVGLAEKHDVYLIVALYPNLVGGAIGNWRLHPYSTQREGGKIEHHYEMVTSEAAKELQRQRFRYFVDHWGKSPHIMSWELFNEFWHPAKGVSKKQNLAAHNRWIDEMGRYIGEYETKRWGRHHLRSVSTMRSEFPRGAKPSDTNIFDSRELDFASYHAYGRTLLEATDSKTDFGILAGSKIEPERMVHAVHDTLGRMLQRAPGRPVLCTEAVQIANPYTPDHNNPLNPVRKMLRGYSDAERYNLFQIANWAYVTSGAAGTPMRYPAGYFEDALYDRQHAVSRIVSEVNWNRFDAKRAHDRITTDYGDLLAFALADKRCLLAWLYHRVEFSKRKPIEPNVTIRGFAKGPYRIRWFNADTGDTLKTEESTASPITVTAPPFSGHVVCLVEAK